LQHRQERQKSFSVELLARAESMASGWPQLDPAAGFTHTRNLHTLAQL
jgi:hypothetical protein